MLYDAAGKLVYSGGVMASDQQTSAFDFGIGAADISQIKLMINPSGITNGSDKLGFREISINGHLMEETADQPLGDISPVLGEMLEVPDGAEAGAWRYFDDRIFNRSQDDYNDLMGFFDVKRGEETLNNYVAAGVYVYSPKDQEVQWQMAGSGIYKLFCNDIPAGAQESVPGDVVKSGTKYSISLKEGWNKLLIQIQHVNPNQKCNLFGFYSRLCDSDGNEIEDLTYSVSGPYTEDGEVQIVTQGLDIDRADFEERNADCTANEYPENTLPYAYEKNPYVGLKSVNTSGSAGQASLFAFQAAGGSPEYTWEIVKGKLPDGLTLNADGTVSGTVEDGAAGDSTKDYTFTLKAEDAEGNTAEKEFTMTAKPHPAQWFEEGRMSALSHCTGTIPNLYDPNYNYDQWAQTAKEMGLTMLSTESYQNSLYYWPSPNANLTPNDSNAQYKYNTMYQDENGEWHIKDRVMEAKEAAERYGLHFGTYLSPQCPQTDIQGLVERYDPWYIFVDGNPQSGVNLDIAFSSARNYNDRVLFNTNPNKEISDQDLTLMERPFWYSQPYVEGGNWENNIKPSGKYVVHEEWNDPYSTALDLWRVWSPGGDQMRDSWPDAMKELIDAVGHGYVMNHDLSIAASRGLDNLIWSGAIRTSMDKDNIYMMVPIDSQQMSDMRVSMAEWLTNEGGPDLHESLFGTMPYYIEYTPAAGWHEAGTQLAFFYGEGPEWGYSLCRDQYVYLHMIENYIEKGRDKSGFTGQDTLEHIGPFDYKVKNVSWLNEGMELEYTQKESGGKYYIDIDTSSVESDPIDTIIKIETENPKREYSMTDIKVFSSQEEGSVLNLRTECYMNDFTSVFAPAEVSYVSLDEKVARTDAVGAVHAVGDGETEIRVTAVYDDGVNEKQVIEETYPVKVSGGNISSNLPLTGIGMFTNEKAFWSEVFAGTTSPVDLKGYTEYGGTVDLLPGVNTENITYHYAVVDGSTNNSEGKIVVTEVSADQVPFELKDGQLVLDEEAGTDKYYCYWADVTANGTVYTSSRNYITLMPDHNVAESVQAEVTSGNAEALTDGVINDVTGGNLVKWSSDKNDSDPTMTFDFGQEKTLTRVNLFYNRGTVDTDSVAYINVPKQVKIEYSLDGKEWKTGNEITELTGDTLPTVESYDQVPTSDKTSYAWEAENIFYNYPVDQDESTVNARYVRISFPGGGQNGTCVDILEARVFGLGSEGGSEEPPAAADKTLLQKTYDYALTLSTDGVVDSAKKFFEDAKAAAAAVLADETATQEEVNAAWDNLLEGIWGLGLVQGDKSSLELLISLGESMMLDADKYVAENWQQFVDAFTEAKAVYEDGDALEDDVQTVSDALLDAILIQRYKADKSILADLIAKTEGIDTAQYTEASAQVFQAAFASAKAMLADESLSIDQQAQVDEMVCTLQAALDGLEPVSTDDGRDEPSGGDDGNTSDDGNTGNDDNTNDPGNGSSDSGNNGNTGGSDRGTGASDEKADTGNSGNTRSGKDAPKTGDNSNVAAVLLILAAAVAAGAGTVFVRKWKKGNK